MFKKQQSLMQRGCLENFLRLRSINGYENLKHFKIIKLNSNSSITYFHGTAKKTKDKSEHQYRFYRDLKEAKRRSVTGQ